MSFVEHLIVGGGISGCLMAHHLAKRHLDFTLIEAQASLGGRIQTSEQGLDLGPTWFWPHQHSVRNLLSELNIDFFMQHTRGDLMYQAHPNQPAQRERSQQNMQSYRVSGGMGAIIKSLQNTLAQERISLNNPIAHVSKKDNLWQLTTLQGEEISCTYLWLAMPPRKIATLFLNNQKPVISEALVSHLQAQQTWMSAQAKFVAEYDNPFWREAGLSGQAFSRIGPMVEINDACGPEHSDTAALFGFIGVPAQNRRSIDQQQMINACIAQLGKLFGEQALTPISTHYVDWANNDFIASKADIAEPSQHAHFNSAQFKQELNDLKLGLIGSEFSQTEPGYIAGAIDHVNQQASGLSL